VQSVATIDDLSDASKQKIEEKMQKWEKSLPRRRKDTMKRIDISLKRQEGTSSYEDVANEVLDSHSPIVSFRQNTINNNYSIEYFILNFL